MSQCNFDGLKLFQKPKVPAILLTSDFEVWFHVLNHACCKIAQLGLSISRNLNIRNPL